MEQKPTYDAAPLVPPTVEVASAYLEEISVIEQRRDALIDRRTVAWLSILNAVVIATFLYLTIVGLREGMTAVTQPVLFEFLIWGQISNGLATRSGVQWRLGRRKWMTIVGTAVIGVVVLVSMFAAIFAPDERDDRIVYVAPLVALVALTGVGARQLWRARGHGPARHRGRRRLSAGIRAATVALGVVLGALTALMSVPESVLTVVLLLLLVLVIVAWIFAGLASGLGIPALAEQWRWPQFTAYALSTAVFFASAASALFGRPTTMPLTAIAGAAMTVLFLLAALLGGRDAD